VRPASARHLVHTLLALLLAAPVAAQDPTPPLEDELARAEVLTANGRAEEARTALEAWWDEGFAAASRRDRQRALWLRARLTVDPFIAEVDYERLVVEYPGGPYSDRALARLAWYALEVGDTATAARRWDALVRDYPGSRHADEARAWLEAHPRALEAQAPDRRPTERAETELRPADPAGRDTVRAEAPSPDAATRGRFAVQLGAFSSEERARALAERLKEQGFEPRLVRVPANRLIRVRIGRFEDRSAANGLRQRVVDAGFEATIVTDAANEEPIG